VRSSLCDCGEIEGANQLRHAITVSPHYEASGKAFVALLQELDDAMADASDGSALDRRIG
jgi:hypothetical protein